MYKVRRMRRRLVPPAPARGAGMLTRRAVDLPAIAVGVPLGANTGRLRRRPLPTG